jgi:hypothetical protein
METVQTETGKLAALAKCAHPHACALSDRGALLQRSLCGASSHQQGWDR